MYTNNNLSGNTSKTNILANFSLSKMNKKYSLLKQKHKRSKYFKNNKDIDQLKEYFELFSLECEFL